MRFLIILVSIFFMLGCTSKEDIRIYYINGALLGSICGVKGAIKMTKKEEAEKIALEITSCIISEVNEELQWDAN